jgi:Tfp pilus assembly protein PilF
MPRQINRTNIGLIALLLTAFLLRFDYILEIKNAPHTLAPAVDAAFHDQWAKQVAKGNLGQAPFFRAPFYPWLLGAVYFVFGDSPLPPRILQVLLSTLSVWLTWSLARRLFGSTAGWIAGIIFALYGLTIFYTGELLIVTLIIFLDVLILWLIVKYFKVGTWWQWGIVGIIMGLSTIARPNILIFLPILLIASWINNHPESLKIKTGRLIAIIIGLLIPILPVSLINRIEGGEWIWIAWQGGINFYIGNNPKATGANAVIPEFGETWELADARNLAEKETGHHLTSGQISNFYYLRGISWMESHPLDWLKLTLKKSLLYFQSYEISDQRNIYFFSSQSKILKYLIWLGFGIVAPLGILGIIFTYKHSKESRVITWFIITYSISFILFFVTARFRMPIVPGLIIFTSVVPVRIYEWLRDRYYRNVIIVFVGAVILFSLCWWNPYGYSRAVDAQTYFSLGNAYLKLKKYSEARRSFQSTLKLDPNYEWVHLNIGVSYWRQGKIDSAETEYLKELELHPESPTAMNNLGVIASEKGNLEKAEEWFRRALTQKPYYDDARINLAETLFRQGYGYAQKGNFAKAEGYLKEAVDLAPDRALYHYDLAVTQAALGQTIDAYQSWEQAHRLDPSLPMLPSPKSATSSPDSLH